MALLDTYQVGVDGPWTDREAAHLLRRAGFAGPPEDRAALVGDGSQLAFEAAVDALVDIQASDPWLDQAPGSTIGTYGDPLSDLPTDDSDLGRLNRAEELLGMIGHFLYRMRYTSQPLQEQLTQFMHDHFVSEWSKIRPKVPPFVILANDGSEVEQVCNTGTLGADELRADKIAAKAMMDQNYLVRQMGMDNFRDLLLNVTRDPAMLVYLDNFENTKGKPQENYAREVMELFSMGEGNYSENDIREISKCLTGETLPNFACENDWDASSGFASAIHEPGNKIVFGQVVNEDFTGAETEEVVDLILSRLGQNPPVAGLSAPYNTLPAASVYLSWKLLRWFVNHDIALLSPDDIVLELADYMRGTDNGSYPQRRYAYDTKAVLRKLFASKYFYDDANYLTMYKTPADYVTGILRSLGIADVFTDNFGPGIQMVLMGQILFSPPNVSGWQHGKSWFTSGSIVARYNYGFYITAVFYSGVDGEAKMDALLAANGGTITDMESLQEIIDYFRVRLLQMDLTTEENDILLDFLTNMPGGNPQVLYYNRVRGLIQLMLSMPIAQLK